MRHAVVIDAVRTPIGRAHKDRGIYRDVRSDDLATHAIKSLIERTGVPVDQVDDVVWGNVMQMGEQGMNMSRNVALMAGLPAETGGTTVNRLCGSSLQALNQAAHAVMSNAEDVQIVARRCTTTRIPVVRYPPTVSTVPYPSASTTTRCGFSATAAWDGT